MLRNWLRLALLTLLLTISFPASAQDDPWLLTGEVEVSNRDVGFYMAYPTGWTAEDAPNATVLYEQPADQQAVLAASGAVSGYTVHFQYYTSREARDMGLPEDAPTPQAWLTLVNTQTHNETPANIADITFLSWPALRARTTDASGNTVELVVGLVGTVPYAITLSAPDADSLDAFLPTWERMLRESDLFKGAVNFGSYSLYLDCMGQGRPTVILEQGMNAGYDYLRQTQEQVAEFTRVCIHEREKPELGKRTARDFAEDLNQLLHTAHVQGPYVFAAHSFGGFVARMYEEEYPDEVIGMVLIDSAHEDQLYDLQQLLSPEYYDSVIDEIRDVPTADFEASAAQVSAIGRLGDMPLIVLTATDVEITAELNSLTWTETWIEDLQPDLARLSTNGRQIIVSDTNHLTILRNQATVDAIRQVVEAAQ